MRDSFTSSESNPTTARSTAPNSRTGSIPPPGQRERDRRCLDLLGHAFDRLGLHKVVAKTYAPNHASRRILEKLGFEREGTFRDEAYVDGEWVDVHRYGLLDADWRTND